jgi:hypothetical protein
MATIMATKTERASTLRREAPDFLLDLPGGTVVGPPVPVGPGVGPGVGDGVAQGSAGDPAGATQLAPTAPFKQQKY